MAVMDSAVSWIISLAHGKFSVVSNQTRQIEGEIHTLLHCAGKEDFVIPVDEHLQFQIYSMHIIRATVTIQAFN